MANNAETHKDIQTKTEGTSQLSVTTPCGWATHVYLQAVGKKKRGPAGWRKTGKGLHAQCGTENSLCTLVIGTEWEQDSGVPGTQEAPDLIRSTAVSKQTRVPMLRKYTIEARDAQ